MEQLNSGYAALLPFTWDCGQVVMLSNRPREGVHEPVESLHLCPHRGILGDRWAETAWLKTSDGAADPAYRFQM